MQPALFFEPGPFPGLPGPAVGPKGPNIGHKPGAGFIILSSLRFALPKSHRAKPFANIQTHWRRGFRGTAFHFSTAKGSAQKDETGNLLAVLIGN